MNDLSLHTKEQLAKYWDDHPRLTPAFIQRWVLKSTGFYPTIQWVLTEIMPLRKGYSKVH